MIEAWKHRKWQAPKQLYNLYFYIRTTQPGRETLVDGLRVSISKGEGEGEREQLQSHLHHFKRHTSLRPAAASRTDRVKRCRYLRQTSMSPDVRFWTEYTRYKVFMTMRPGERDGNWYYSMCGRSCMHSRGFQKFLRHQTSSGSEYEYSTHIQNSHTNCAPCWEIITCL